MSSLATVAATLRDLARPGMKPKALLAAVRERHPEISKKDVVRAAFYALTESDGETVAKRGRLRSDGQDRTVRKAPLG